MYRKQGRGKASLQSSAQYDFEEGQRVGIQKSERGYAKATSLRRHSKQQTPVNTPGGMRSMKSTATMGATKSHAFDDSRDFFGATATQSQNYRTPQPSVSPRDAYNEAESAWDTTPRSPGYDGDKTPARSPRTPRRKVPLPKPHDQGRWVKHDRNLDSRGGTSLRGPLFREDPYYDNDEEDPYEDMKDLIQKDKGDQTVKFCGFTDRTIRLQDGKAMKAVFKPPTNWNMEDDRKPGEFTRAWKTDCKPQCNCAVCKPMRTSLLPPAGHVVQVDVGNCGTPPYVLQTQMTGLMAVMPETNEHGEFKKGVQGRNASLGTTMGRHFFRKQRLAEYEDLDKKENDMKIARGCEPEDKKGDHLQVSDGVALALVDGTGSPNDADVAMRKEMGHRHPIAAPGDGLNRVSGMLVYEGDPKAPLLDTFSTTEGVKNAKMQTLAKKRVEASWTKTKIFLGNIEPEEAPPPQRRLRGSGEFNSNYVHAFSREQVRKGRSTLLRYEGCPTARLQGVACMGVGDEVYDKEMRDFRHHKVAPFSSLLDDHLVRSEGSRTPGATPRGTPRGRAPMMSRSASCPPAAMAADPDCPNIDLGSMADPPIPLSARGGEERSAASSTHVGFALEEGISKVPTPSRRRESLSDSGFAGVPSGVFRETGRQQARENLVHGSKNITKCIATRTIQDEVNERQERLDKEPKFKNLVEKTLHHHNTAGRVFEAIRNDIHHLRSSNVQDALSWS